MRRLLLDTHTFLWLNHNDPRLSQIARDAISQSSSKVLLSVASGMEIAIKVGKGRLRLGMPLTALLAIGEEQPEFDWLPILPAHLVRLAALPQQDHADPFDRLIASQTLVEDLTLVSADPALDAYGVRRLW